MQPLVTDLIMPVVYTRPYIASGHNMTEFALVLSARCHLPPPRMLWFCLLCCLSISRIDDEFWWKWNCWRGDASKLDIVMVVILSVGLSITYWFGVVSKGMHVSSNSFHLW